MIYDIQNQGGAVEGGRTLAVVAGRPERAQEVASCFAEQGDRVKALWYPDTKQLIEAERNAPLEAVILFVTSDDAVGDAEEAEVRGVFRETPLYRL